MSKSQKTEDLFQACSNGSLERVKTLLDQKSTDVNEERQSGPFRRITPLLIAASRSKTDVVKLMLTADVPVSWNKTVLFSPLGITRCCDTLVKAGAWPDDYAALPGETREALDRSRFEVVWNIQGKLIALRQQQKNEVKKGIFEMPSLAEEDPATAKIKLLLGRYKAVIDTHMVNWSSTKPTASRKKIDALCKQAGIKLSVETTEAEAGAEATGAAEAEKPTLCTLS